MHKVTPAIILTQHSILLYTAHGDNGLECIIVESKYSQEVNVTQYMNRG